MDIIRKSLKAYLIAVVLFLMLTFVLALIIKYTVFSESWAHIGLIVILAATTLFLGMIEGRLVGKRGLITGLVSSAVFVLIILISVGSVFAGNFSLESFDILYVIPLISGIVGAVIGTNRSK